MSIQRYLEQLIEEIDEKIKIPSPASIRKVNSEDFFHELNEIDELMEFHGIPVTKYSKILKVSLPPPEKLNLEQADQLVYKISDLLDRWNLHLEYPESTPVKEKYRLIYENWEEFEIPTSGLHFHQDFCSGSCEECEIKAYCETFNHYKDTEENIDEDFDPEPLDMDFIIEKNSDKSAMVSESEKDKINSVLVSLKEKDFIPSIHNYCDRWCDRCSLKTKCSLYYFETELLKIAASDNSGRSSSDSVNHIYSMTHDILQENLEDEGIDLDLPVKTNDSFFPKIPAREQKVLDFAKEYSFSTSQWLKDFPEEKVVANHDLLEPLNVLLYYHIFISAKLARAFFGRVSYPNDDPYQNDSNGSAKIALIAIKKSLNAWANMLKLKKEMEEDILKQCVKLKKLQKMVKTFFPHADLFIRPGFDFISE